MKRTLLALALMLASTGLFAQVGMLRLDHQMQKKSVSQMERQTVKMKKNVDRVAKDGEIEDLCDFSDASAYSFGTNAAHSVSGWGWNLQADTNGSFGLSGDYLNYWLLGISEENPEGDGWWIFDTESYDYDNPTWANGFAYLDLLTIWRNDLHTGVMDCYLALNNPISGTGTLGTDIYINQALQRFNVERYFIEWSNDPTFTTYDSLEFNVRGLELNSNEAAIGVKRLTLPKHTPNANSIGDLVYIRFRYTSPAGEPGENGQPHSYFWFIDDVRYVESPEHRSEVVKTTFDVGAYHRLPAVITPDTLVFTADIENTGATDYTDAVLKNKIYSVQLAETEGGEDVYTQVAANVSEEYLLSNTTNEVVESINGSDTTFAAMRTVSMVAGSTHLVTENPGLYAVISEVSADAMSEPLLVGDTTYYQVVEPSADLNGSYRWARDRHVLIERWGNFKYGFMRSGPNMYLTDEAAWNRAGYEICLPFTADYTSEDLYLNGVEVVPALDSCQAGAQIIGKLRKIDWSAGDWESLIVEVMDAWDTPVESEVYELQQSDLNNGLCTDPEFLDVLGADEFRSIYLPFKNSVELEPGETYFACYRMASNGRFMIAADDPRYPGSFGPGATGYTQSFMLIFTPGLPTNPSTGNFAWGGRPYYSDYCDGKTPLIHMVIGDASTRSLSEEIAVATSLNAYPNPATDNATISYSLKKAGNVSIVITDLMGRVVMNMEEGNQNAGVNYTVNVNTANLANGTYFYTLNVNGEKQTKKFVVSK